MKNKKKSYGKQQVTLINRDGCGGQMEPKQLGLGNNQVPIGIEGESNALVPALLYFDRVIPISSVNY